MKKTGSMLLSIMLFLLSCNSNEKKSPQTDTETATTFIRDVLNNNLSDAETFLLQDETNGQYFESFKQQYSKKDKAELEKFKSADIIINEISNVSDTITIVNYSNSYKKDVKNKIKLVRINGKWLIDLKYTFSGNM